MTLICTYYKQRSRNDAWRRQRLTNVYSRAGAHLPPAHLFSLWGAAKALQQQAREARKSKKTFNPVRLKNFARLLTKTINDR